MSRDGTMTLADDFCRHLLPPAIPAVFHRWRLAGWLLELQIFWGQRGERNNYQSAGA
jgi:hypothetical protein